MNERNDKLDGPYRVADVITVWTRIARMIDHLFGLKVVPRDAIAVRRTLDELDDTEVPDIDDPSVNVALAVLAAPDAMCASDWLRMKVVDARGSTNVALHALDLRGLHCRRLVVRFDADVCRVTVHNTRGDIASCESTNFGNALKGAIAMAGARRETAT